MEAGDNLHGLVIQRLIIKGIGEATDQRPPHAALNHWECLGVFPDDLNKRLNSKLKTAASARSLSFIPGPGHPNVAASCDPINDAHGRLVRWEKAGFHLVPCEVLGARIRQAPSELLLVPLGHRHLSGVCGNTVPNLLKQLQPLLNGEAENLFQKRLRCHEGNFNGSPMPRKLCA
jgi:hypothetical protein